MKFHRSLPIRTFLPLAFALLALQAPREVGAATATYNFNVTATVQTACSVTASDLAFGNYDAATPTDTLAASTISVTCSLLTPYTISLNGGTHAAGAVRKLASGSSRLNYELYSDAGMTGIFGTVANLLGVSGIGTGFAATHPVYGKIPKNQAALPGSYTDQITVTIDY